MESREKLEVLIFEALGRVSMCWTPTPTTQVFDSTRAKEIGDKLIKDLQSLSLPPSNPDSYREVVSDEEIERACDEALKKSGYDIDGDATSDFTDGFARACEWFQSRLSNVKEVVSDEEIGDYAFDASNGLENSDQAFAFVKGAIWMRSRLSNVTDKSDAVDINFVVWYSGMKEENVKKALERYKREVIYKQSKTK